jgi:hypothetical protein
MDYSFNLGGTTAPKKPTTGAGAARSRSVFKPLIKCAGLGGNTSSIAKKKAVPIPKKPTSGIFEAKP